MAQSEHLDQPDDAADLGSAVQLDSSDTLDGPAGGADALDAGYVPPDRPVALDDDGVTGAGMLEGDTLDERLARERPEETAGDPTRSGRLTGGGAALETADAIEGTDVGVDGGAASAEEAAVHDVRGDTRVDGEPSVADAPQLADPEVDAVLDDAVLGDGGDAVEQARRDVERDVSDTVDEGTAPRG